MSGNEMVRLWKDPDARGAAAHPSGDIALDELSGGVQNTAAYHLTVVSVAVMRCPPVSHLFQVCPPQSCHTYLCFFEES